MLLSSFPAGNCGSKLQSFFETLGDHTAFPWRLQKTQLLWELVQIKFTGCLDPNPDGKLWLVILLQVLQSLYNRNYILYITLIDNWKAQSYRPHTIMKASNLETTMILGGIPNRSSFLKDLLKQDFLLSFNSEQPASVQLCQMWEHFWPSCSCEKVCVTETGWSTKFVRVNIWTEPITPCACSRTRFQPPISSSRWTVQKI